MAARHICPPSIKSLQVCGHLRVSDSCITAHTPSMQTSNFFLPKHLHMCPVALTSSISAIPGIIKFLHVFILKRRFLLVTPCTHVLLPRRRTVSFFQPLPTMLSIKTPQCESMSTGRVAVLQMLGHLSDEHSNLASSQSAMSASCTNCKGPTYKPIAPPSQYCKQPLGR